MLRILSLTCLALTLNFGCSGDDGGNDDTDQAANSGDKTDDSNDQSADVPADQAGGASGSQLTECDTDVPSDGVCDINVACAAYDPDCTDEDIAAIPPGEETDDAAANAAGGGPAGGSQLTECETDVPSDGVCDINVACAAYDPDCTDEDIAAIPPGEETDDAAANAAGGGPAGGSQLTECETDVPSDGVCDINVACAAYDPDCTDEDIAAIPPGEETDEAAAAAAGGGLAGGSQLTACDENQVADDICDENEPCAGYDPDCGYEAPDCELEPAADGHCDLDDECWGYDPDCEMR